MKFRCDRDALSEALQTVQRGVSSRPGIPALTGVLIEASPEGALIVDDYAPVGSLQLKPGVHRVRLDYTSANLWPGSGGTPFGLGPLILSRTTQELPVNYVDPADAGSLCGRSLDWIEALAA